MIKLPANLILSKSSGCKITVEVTPPEIPAIKCSYLTCESNFDDDEIKLEFNESFKLLVSFEFSLKLMIKFETFSLKIEIMAYMM